MKTISGYVESIIYRNESTGYSVISVLSKGIETACTGVFGYINEGEMIELEGEEVNHEIYGKQIKMTSYRIMPATDSISIIKYLSSGAIKGIGTTLAKRVVDHFGEDTFQIMEEEPERLSEIKGISMRMAMEISEQVEVQREMREVMIYLQKFNISPAMSVKIYELYGPKTYDVIQTNPYRLSEDIMGMSFMQSDEIAQQIGVEVGASIRIKSGMKYALTQASQNGHTYLPKEDLVAMTVNMLGLRDQYMQADGTYNMELLDHCFTESVLDKKLIIKEIDGQEAVFLPPFYNTEMAIANKLEELNVYVPESDFVTKVKMETIEDMNKVELDDTQKLAIMNTQNYGVSVITGGPGTGKTTIINTIIKMFESDGCEVALTAPTGRAAKRMSEATGKEAMTIHRMLEVLDQGGEELQTKFAHNESNPLEADVVIVDEMSMVDIFLFDSLLKAMIAGMRLVIVGDINQLASVGPGNVLKDIIESDQFAVTSLQTVYRQEEKSSIVANAHRINAGEMIPFENVQDDFLFVERNNMDQALDATLRLVDKVAQHVNANPFDVQVLAPMRKGLLGINNLNIELQKKMNPASRSKEEWNIHGVNFREGDKVMQVKNDYETIWNQKADDGKLIDSGKGIFNGDLGVITKINRHTNTMEVKFDDDRYVIFFEEEAENLELAYAVTIHKSQGSEYPAVIMPLLQNIPNLMTRNLLYTGVTRAMNCVCIVGSQKTFHSMIANVDEHKRYSGLKNFICLKD